MTTESRTKLYVANLDGSERRLVTILPGIAQLPRWLQTYDGSKDVNILVVDVGRGDYKLLLFQSNRDGVMEVYRMTDDGRKQFRLSR